MESLTRARRILLLVGLLAVGGCAAHGGRASDNPFERGGPPAERLILRANNLLSEDVAIRVIDGARTMELGSVPGRSTRQFNVQWSGSSRLGFQLEPLSGRRHSLPLVSVEPGAVLELVIQLPIENSSIRR